MNNNLLLVGAGSMSIEYAKVLIHLGIDFEVVGRGSKSAEIFSNHINISPILGGLNQFFVNNNKNFDTAIVATSTDSLMDNLLLLLRNGFKKILIEKPAAISIDELIANHKEISSFKSKIFVAYNRRFFNSIKEVKKIIENDGGLQSMFFEFTEWIHLIEKIDKVEENKNLFFVNSTHVIDLAFFIAGKPTKWETFTKKGEIDWHPISQFSGSGITDKNVLFSYITNWESSGRWSIELFTNKRRIYLKPLEKIFIQEKGSVELKEYKLSNSTRDEFKDGLLDQVLSFLDDDYNYLLDFDEHIWNTKNIYSKILNK